MAGGGGGVIAHLPCTAPSSFVKRRSQAPLFILQVGQSPRGGPVALAAIRESRLLACELRESGQIQTEKWTSVFHAGNQCQALRRKHMSPAKRIGWCRGLQPDKNLTPSRCFMNQPSNKSTQETDQAAPNVGMPLSREKCYPGFPGRMEAKWNPGP